MVILECQKEGFKNSFFTEKEHREEMTYTIST